MFLSEAIEDYAAYSRGELGHSQNTVYTYRSRQRLFLAWLAKNETPDREVEKVTAYHIRRYSYFLSSRGQRPRSIRGALNSIRSLYAYLVQMGAVESNPGLEVRLPKKDAARRRLVSDEELMRLLKACEQQRKEFRVVRDKALLAVLIFCGLRRQELLDLTVQCLSLEKKVILVEQGKGGKSRTIYLCEECVGPLRDWMALRSSLKVKNDWLFVNESRKHMGATTLMNILEDIKGIAGFKGDPRIKPHSIRHAAATRLMRNGADIKSIQVWLGHSSLNTTAIYLHTDEEHVRMIAEKSGFGPPRIEPGMGEPAANRRAEYHLRRRTPR
jgi:integrase/recombinase XerD